MERGQVTVQIMAGGRSSRMGRDKAGVLLGGETLAMRALRTWRGWGGELFYSTGSQPAPDWLPGWARAVPDLHPDNGPLGGLEAGLCCCATPYLLLCAVDLPFVTPEHGERLLAGIGGADVCMYRLAGRPEPLFGLYRVEGCRPAVQRRLAEGSRRLCGLLEECASVLIPTEEARMFLNLNTPEDVERAARLLDGEGP